MHAEKAGIPRRLSGLLTLWDRSLWEGKVKISRFSQKQLKELLKRQKEREHWKWECVRRNEDYKKDFEKYGGKQLNRRLSDKIFEKWERFVHLPDPEIEDPDIGYGAPDAKVAFGDVFDMLSGSRIHLWKPGSVLKKIDGTVEEIREWTVYNSDIETQEELTPDNLPEYITITIRCEPGSQIGELEAILLKVFGKMYKKLLAAQKMILKASPRARFVEFKNYMDVYDFKKRNPCMTWAEIGAAKIGKKKDGSEKQNARDYYKKAENLIEKEGWKML